MAIVKKEDLPKEYQDIWESFIMPVDTNIQIADVILSEDNKSKIQAFLKETAYRDKLINFGLDPMNRILMYGASGTGKTYLTKALSNHLKYTMIYIDIAQALTDGTVAINISQIFKLANYIGECVIMLDECDSIAWKRDGSTQERGDIRRATNSIFQQLDQMNKTNIFVAATNMLNNLDAAFERRFNMKMEFRRPDKDLDDSIRFFTYPAFDIEDDVDETVREIVKRRAKQYVKLSYYEIEGIVHRAMKNAVLRDSRVVLTSEIYDMLSTSMNLKIHLGTAKDDEAIFHNESSYDPSLV